MPGYVSLQCLIGVKFRKDLLVQLEGLLMLAKKFNNNNNNNNEFV